MDNPQPSIRLSSQQAADLAMYERALHDLLPDLDALEKCGTDCTCLRAENERVRQQVVNLRALFGRSTSNLP
jgi:hypothetical protein